MADGMGGHVAGKTASLIAVTEVKAFFDQHPDDKNLPPVPDTNLSLPAQKLKQAIEHAGQSIFDAGKQDAELKGMGSTIVSLFVAGDTAYIAHVGDSRLYRLRDQELSQLTQDHSLVGKMLRKGEITPEEARRHPQRHIITRALGTQTTKVDMQEQPLVDGDTFLLCSDGLYGMVAEDDIKAAMLAPVEEFESAGRNLIALANQQGGADNITLIMVRTHF